MIDSTEYKRKMVVGILRSSANLKNAFQRNKKTHTYLFILSPPFSGSTLLHDILQSSADVSSNNPTGKKEGQYLLPVLPLMTLKSMRRGKWIPWQYVRFVWNRYWDYEKKILLEKSPTNIFHVEQISKTFQPIQFIALIRNPYAFCEGHVRRRNSSYPEAAQRWVLTAETQMRNMRIGMNILLLRYEDLTDNPSSSIESIREFLPAIGELDVQAKYETRSIVGGSNKILNMNEQKIQRLSNSDISAINSVLMEYEDTLGYFGYDMILEGRSHSPYERI